MHTSIKILGNWNRIGNDERKICLHRTRQVIIHSIKTQQQDFELFPTRESELVVDGLSVSLPGGYWYCKQSGVQEQTM